jgi:hypothetical protein
VSFVVKDSRRLAPALQLRPDAGSGVELLAFAEENTNLPFNGWNFDALVGEEGAAREARLRARIRRDRWNQMLAERCASFHSIVNSSSRTHLSK